MIISYIEDKKKKKTRVADRSGVQKNKQRRCKREEDDMELREVREWCCVKERDFFCSDPGCVGLSKGLLGVGRAGNVHGKTRDPNARHQIGVVACKTKV
jgi:hypothetical protein